jgi:hypothetical protein
MEGRLTIRNVALVGLVLAAVALCFVYLFYRLGGSEAWAQEDCREVLVFGPETESQITSPFEITGNSFRISGEATSPDPDRPPIFNIQPPAFWKR